MPVGVDELPICHGTSHSAEQQQLVIPLLPLFDEDVQPVGGRYVALIQHVFGAIYGTE